MELRKAPFTDGTVVVFYPDDFGTRVYWYGRLGWFDIWRYEDKGSYIIFIRLESGPRDFCFSVKVWTKDVYVRSIKYDTDRETIVNVSAKPDLFVNRWLDRGRASPPGSVFEAVGL